MARKTKKPSTVATCPAAEVETESLERLEKAVLRPSMNAAIVIQEFCQPFGKLDLRALADTLADSIDDGDMKQCEAMLLGQAHALQTIFVTLSLRAIGQEHVRNYETHLRLALKAQSQCRATLEVLACIKNPPVVFARQANIAHGPQQVNNAVPRPGGESLAQASKTESTRNELLEVQDGERLDAGTAGAAIGADSKLEAVGAILRPENR